MIQYIEGKSPDEKFDKYDNALDRINKIQNGKIKLTDVKNDQIIFISDLGEVKKGNNKKDQKSKKKGLYNIDMLYNARNEAIKLFDDYSSMISEAKK